MSGDAKQPELSPLAVPAPRSPAWILAGAAVLTVVLLGLARIDGNGTSPPSAPRDGLRQVEPGWWEETREIYHGIPTRLLFRSPSGVDAAAAAQAAWSRFDQVGATFNAFDATSEVGRLNASSKTSPVQVSPDLFQVLQECMLPFERSHGAFDPTVWPLKMLWKTAVKRQRAPSSDEVHAAVARVGLRRVHLEADRRLSFATPDAQLDFGAVIKGWAVDRVREVLQSQGVTDGLVQCGGEVSAFGQHASTPWKVGVQHPRNADAVWGTLQNTGALRCSTSGNYQQPLMIDGRAYYHIFDPRTGMPVDERLVSVTMVALGDGPSNALLDATATAVAVLGADQGLQLARELGMEAVLVVEQDGALVERRTDGLEHHFLPAGGSVP